MVLNSKSPVAFFATEEEAGKRDDDYKYGKKRPATWHLRNPPSRRNIKNVLIGIAVLVSFYYFFKNIPTDGPYRGINRRPHYEPLKPGVYDPWIPSSAHNAPSISNKAAKPAAEGSLQDNSSEKPPAKKHSTAAESAQGHDFDGPIKFYDLADSLQKAHAQSTLSGAVQKNILFAAANLKSVAKIIPLACAMAEWKRNNVHIAIMGRDDITLALLKSVNNVAPGCNIMFHDARPDYSVHSTDRRMAVSVGAALLHLNFYLTEQAIIIDSSGSEEPYFFNSIKDKAALIGVPVIELPRDAAQDLMWFTRLDAASLNVWNDINIDIVVHAQQAASGSLIRLLTSLWKADYSASFPPRLTIELPQRVDPPTEEFLKSFKWPPPRHDGTVLPNLLMLHHRVPSHSVSAEESSARIVEAFWPSNPTKSHVLILAPHVEVSPIYFHYLKYTLLEYVYSAAAAKHPAKMLGISLDLPTTDLSDTKPFSAPESLFLWQSPNSNAALYLGTVWRELHSLLTHLNTHHETPIATTIETSKQVASTYPSWLEHLLTLARLRGYVMLYPRLSSTTEALITIHKELYQAPEEALQLMYGARKTPINTSDLSALSSEYLSDKEHHLSLIQPETKIVKKKLIDVLYPDAILPSLDTMKILSWDTMELTGAAFSSGVTDYAALYRREVGACKTADVSATFREGQVRDLFCFGNDVELADDAKAAALPVSPAGNDIETNQGPGDALWPKAAREATPPVATDSAASAEESEPEFVAVQQKKDDEVAPHVKKGEVPEYQERHLPGNNRIKGTGL